MADEITSEQLEDYTEAFNLFNQVMLLGSLCGCMI